MNSGASMPSAPTLSIIIPAYDEETRIGQTLTEYVAHFNETIGGDFEIIVVLNGCRDDTRSVVQQIMNDATQIRILEFVEPLGKGGAIWEGFGAARAELLVFADADNMVSAPETQRLINALNSYDVAIGDRISGRETNGGRSPLRWLISTLGRVWVRFFLGLPYHDTQCGAKAFRANAWRAIAPYIMERGWGFDLDVLAQVRATRLSVAEIPVLWHHHAGSKVRPWIDVPQTLAATIGIRRRARSR